MSHETGHGVLWVQGEINIHDTIAHGTYLNTGG